MPSLDSTPDDPAARDGVSAFRVLPLHVQQRSAEFSRLLEPVIRLTDSYGELVARAVWAAGTTRPTDEQDSVVRDLAADVFDSLCVWREIVISGRETAAFPSARRAFESLSLLSACAQDEDVARRWQGGKQIPNREVRKLLAGLPHSESADDTKALYGFFSDAAHPNRNLVAQRLLGDGNSFTLGAIGQPNLVIVTNHCIQLIQMWHWLLGCVAN